MEIEKYIYKEVLRKFDFYNYGHALEILHDAFPEELNDIFKNEKDDKGDSLIRKYGASTTWMGKLTYRLDSRRNGGCPILAVGIRKECVEGYDRLTEYYDRLTEFHEREEI